MKTFEFNDCDVCLNPNEYKVYEGKSWYHSAVILTAKTARGWVFGRHVHCVGDTLGNWGSCSGCSASDERVFDTEKEAFLAGVQDIAQMKNISPQIAKALKSQAFFPEFEQLTLF